MPTPSADEIRERVAALGPWFHNLDLAGVKTAPDHFLGDYPTLKWRRFAEALPADFTGKTVAGKPLKWSQYKGKVVLLNFFDRY